MTQLPLILFLLSATALLGSPGPGIAALIAVGRAAGFRQGLRYYLGLQLGLGLAAGLCAAGLLSALLLVPGLLQVLTSSPRSICSISLIALPLRRSVSRPISMGSIYERHQMPTVTD